MRFKFIYRITACDFKYHVTFLTLFLVEFQGMKYGYTANRAPSIDGLLSTNSFSNIYEIKSLSTVNIVQFFTSSTRFVCDEFRRPTRLKNTRSSESESAGCVARSHDSDLAIRSICEQLPCECYVTGGSARHVVDEAAAGRRAATAGARPAALQRAPGDCTIRLHSPHTDVNNDVVQSVSSTISHYVI